MRYFERDGALFRSTDDSPLPDEVLWSEGWVELVGQLTVSADAHPRPSRRGGPGNAADPAMLTQIDRITRDEAEAIARRRGLPIEGW